MSTFCDSESIDYLRQTIGKKLETVVAFRYPGVLAYRQVIAKFAGDTSVTIDLRDELVEPMFEVFVVQVRNGCFPEHLGGWDRFTMDNFVIGKVSLLRRMEWIEIADALDKQLVGNNQNVQRFGDVADKDTKCMSVAVDSGIFLKSIDGAEISIDADVFPMVMQFHYKVASSVIPEGLKIDLDPI